MKYIICLTLIISSLIFSQSVDESLNSSVYKYLDGLSIKGVISFRNDIRPVTRKYIAGLLSEISLHQELLSSIEREELAFYKKEYYSELISLDTVSQVAFTQYLGLNDSIRFRLAFYYSKDFTVSLDPVLGQSMELFSGGQRIHRWDGIKYQGTYGKSWGFNFYFRDNQERGTRVDKTKIISPENGINVIKDQQTSIEYDEIEASVSYAWSSGSLSLGKSYLEWGSGTDGQLIMSQKAPSFPMFKFIFSPLPWMDFTYIFASLHSRILDSSTIMYNPSNRSNFLDVPKFLVAHVFSFYPGKYLTFFLGESIVYSERIQPIYFIPILFFRAADHYLQDNTSNTGSNAQMYGNISYILPKLNLKTYATLFIDELSIEGLLKGQNLSSIGFTTGIKVQDLLLENSSLNIEYTRINPFVYENGTQTQTYASFGYQMGHWIGSNTDLIHFSYNKKFLRGLMMSINFDNMRKGQEENPQDQYRLPYPDFLYGEKKRSMTVSMDLSYEVLNELICKFYISYYKNSDENKFRTQLNELGTGKFFGISLSYGN